MTGTKTESERRYETLLEWLTQLKDDLSSVVIAVAQYKTALEKEQQERKE